MLLKSSISDIVIHSDDWFAGRLAKFTSSEIHNLMGERGLGDTGIRYIYRKVGEELTGKPCRKEISTEATEHGHINEPLNLRKFASILGLEYLVTQKLIIPIGGREGSTPDAIIPKSERSSKDGYDVTTVEAKCPSSYDNYIRLWKCKTPQDVKKANSTYYWQVLHQMRVCGALDGYLTIFHPDFKAGDINIVKFKKVDLLSDFKTLNDRVEEAVKIFNETRDEMINSKM